LLVSCATINIWLFLHTFESLRDLLESSLCEPATFSVMSKEFFMSTKVPTRLLHVMLWSEVKSPDHARAGTFSFIALCIIVSISINSLSFLQILSIRDSTKSVGITLNVYGDDVFGSSKWTGYNWKYMRAS